MAYSEAHKRAAIKYAKNHYKRVPLDLDFSKYEEVKMAAEAAGESVNGFIKAAVEERLQRYGEAVRNIRKTDSSQSGN